MFARLQDDRGDTDGSTVDLKERAWHVVVELHTVEVAMQLGSLAGLDVGKVDDVMRVVRVVGLRLVRWHALVHANRTRCRWVLHLFELPRHGHGLRDFDHLLHRGGRQGLSFDVSRLKPWIRFRQRGHWRHRGTAHRCHPKHQDNETNCTTAHIPFLYMEAALQPGTTPVKGIDIEPEGIVRQGDVILRALDHEMKHAAIARFGHGCALAIKEFFDPMDLIAALGQHQNVGDLHGHGHFAYLVKGFYLAGVGAQEVGRLGGDEVVRLLPMPAHHDRIRRDGPHPAHPFPEEVLHRGLHGLIVHRFEAADLADLAAIGHFNDVGQDADLSGKVKGARGQE